MIVVLWPAVSDCILQTHTPSPMDQIRRASMLTTFKSHPDLVDFHSLLGITYPNLFYKIFELSHGASECCVLRWLSWILFHFFWSIFNIKYRCMLYISIFTSSNTLWVVGTVESPSHTPAMGIAEVWCKTRPIHACLSSSFSYAIIMWEVLARRIPYEGNSALWAFVWTFFFLTAPQIKLSSYYTLYHYIWQSAQHCSHL